MPLPHYCGLSSPQVEFTSRISNTSRDGGLTPYLTRPGLCASLRLPCPCRPTPSARGLNGPLCVGVGRRDGVPSQRPFQPHQPRLSSMQLRRFATTWRVVACPFGLCAFAGWRPCFMSPVTRRIKQNHRCKCGALLRSANNGLYFCIAIWA